MRPRPSPARRDRYQFQLERASLVAPVPGSKGLKDPTDRVVQNNYCSHPNVTNNTQVTRFLETASST